VTFAKVLYFSALTTAAALLVVSVYKQDVEVAITLGMVLIPAIACCEHGRSPR
jgi:hypothetical protein